MILPSKKVLSIFILTVALVVAVIITFGREKSSGVINSVNNLVAGEKISIPENPNWQNELGGVTTNTEPIQEEDTSTTETATDVVSKTLMSNYLALKQSGTLDATSAQKLVDQTASLVGQLGSSVVLDTKLNIIPDNGLQSITNYGENLGNILKNNKPTEIKNEIEIISTAVSSRDPSKINELDPIIVIYEKIASDFEKMPVPKTFVRAHLDMTNGVKGITVALKEMKSVFSDPIKSLAAMQLYQEGIIVFTQPLQASRAFIYQNKIIYKQGSGGYYLLYGI